MNRRIFLRGIGGALLAAPMLSSLHEKSVRGQAAADPRRLVIFFTHNGCLTDRWFPKVEDGALTADAFTGTTLAPLIPYLPKLLVPRGIKSLNQYGTTQTIDPHDQAMGSKLTCALVNDDTTRYATAESLDHTIAKQINPGGVDPWVLTVGTASTSIKDVLSFSGPSTAFPATANPTTVYNQLTGLFGKASATGTSTTPAADYHVQQGKSVIDLVNQDLTRYQKLKMSTSDQKKISDWLDLLRTTETMGAVPASCTTDAATQLGVTSDTVKAASSGSGFGQGLATAFTAGGDMMMNLMALGMMCDAQRVMILTYPGYVTFTWDGMMHDADHHGLSHRNGSIAVGGTCHAGVLDMLAQIDNWFAGKFARLVGLLDGVTEGTGTLLDNTATMWLQELSDGNAHNTNNLPILVAGGAGGYLKTGYAVNVEGKTVGAGNSDADCSGTDTSVGFNTGSSTGNVPINKLYVTLMNAVGCKGPDGGKVTAFGQFDGKDATAGITNPGEFASLTSTG
jgi:hypothetical protein